MSGINKIQIVENVTGPGFVDVWDWFSKMSRGGKPRSPAVMVGYPYADSNHLVCVVPDRERHYADLIVTAVNAHADLMNAAQAAVYALKSYEYGNSSPELAQGVIVALEAALKLARSET